MKQGAYSFYLRTAGAFFAVTLLLFICGTRILAVNQKGYSAAAARQGQYTLNIYKHRGSIFDRNFNSLTNISGATAAAVVATPQSLTRLQSALSSEDFYSAAERLKSGKPILLHPEEKLSASGITLFSTYQRYSGLAPHIVGYLDSSGHGESGIEAAWDSLLYSETCTSINYKCDAAGNALAGITPEIFNLKNDAVDSGVVLTIDSRIQQIVQEETTALGCGAAVVLSPQTGDILALHSFPAFDQSNPQASLSSKDSPFLCRALQGYNTGSVFKSCIAAAALESGDFTDQTFVCDGYINVDGIKFVCNKSAGHGEMDLRSALARSCNVYFYKLALATDPAQLYSTALKMGFGEEIKLASGLITKGGSLPNQSLLTTTPAAVANFAIGQGDVMISPLNLAAAYAAIANGGTYYNPRLVLGIKDKDTFSPATTPQGNRVLSPATCATINKALTLAVAEGTGTAAKMDHYTAAGKTATAQTGWQKGGKNVLISWFAGYFPADSPRYVIVIMKEDGRSGSADCAPIFKKIADRIAAMA